MAKPEKEKSASAAEPDKQAATPFLRRRVGLLAVVVVLGAIVFAAVQLQRQASAPGEAAKTAAAPAVGGPFTLVDQNGRTVTEVDFAGKFMLIYFGYTYCPDVCPTALTDMGAAIDALGPDGNKVTPVFITVDPERDTSENLKEYVGFFHPRLVGLTGTPAQVTAAAKAYRVYYAKGPAAKSDALDYLMDHTSIIYLMGPDGKMKANFSHRTGVEAMAKRIKELL
jgi:protein SCO1/2